MCEIIKDAIITLQFYFEEDETTCILITKDNRRHWTKGFEIGTLLAKTKGKLLEQHDLDMLKDFCNGFLKEMEE